MKSIKSQFMGFTEAEITSAGRKIADSKLMRISKEVADSRRLAYSMHRQ